MAANWRDWSGIFFYYSENQYYIEMNKVNIYWGELYLII